MTPEEAAELLRTRIEYGLNGWCMVVKGNEDEGTVSVDPMIDTAG